MIALNIFCSTIICSSLWNYKYMSLNKIQSTACSMDPLSRISLRQTKKIRITKMEILKFKVPRIVTMPAGSNYYVYICLLKELYLDQHNNERLEVIL